MDTSNATPSKDEIAYSDLAKKALGALEIAISSGQVSEVDSIVLLLEISQAKNAEELRAKISKLSERYPAIAETFYLEKEEQYIDFDSIVEKYITHLIKNGKTDEIPEVMKKVEESSKNVEKLKEFYPEIVTLTQ